MMRLLKITTIIAATILLSSCYDDYVYDNEVTMAGFSLEKPLRTVVHGSPMYIGVSISGKREVDMSDWAKYTVDPSLLTGTGYTLLPDNYYTVSDPEIMKVCKSNLPVADVEINFTDAFYSDPNSISAYYALPLRVTDSSLTEIREGGETTVAVIKYISSYSGTYYVMGSVSRLENGQQVSTDTYRESELSSNFTRYLSTQGPMVLNRPGLGRQTAGGLILTISETENGEERSVTVKGSDNNIPVTDASGVYTTDGKYNFAGSDKIAPEIHLEYKYELNGEVFQVSETLVLRRYAVDDLRVETWDS